MEQTIDRVARIGIALLALLAGGILVVATLAYDRDLEDKEDGDIQMSKDASQEWYLLDHEDPDAGDPGRTLEVVAGARPVLRLSTGDKPGLVLGERFSKVWTIGPVKAGDLLRAGPSGIAVKHNGPFDEYVVAKALAPCRSKGLIQCQLY